MPKRRMIEPSIWQDESFGNLSDKAKILFIGLISNADDEGRILANAPYLRSTIFMYEELSVGKVTELRNEVVHKMKNVVLYSVDAKEYIQLEKWETYQKIREDRKKPSTIPIRGDNAAVCPPNAAECPPSIVKVSIDKVNIYSPEFEKFWETYPRKEVKSKAYKCWSARIKEKITAELMITCAKNYSELCIKESKEIKFIKLPATFLSKDRDFETFKVPQNGGAKLERKSYTTSELKARGEL